MLCEVHLKGSKCLEDGLKILGSRADLTVILYAGFSNSPDEKDIEKKLPRNDAEYFLLEGDPALDKTLHIPNSVTLYMNRKVFFN